MTDSQTKSAEGKKKKGDKIIDILKKKAKEFKSEEEKIDFFCEKYAELLADYKESKNSNDLSSKQVKAIQKEKDQLQKDYNKVILQKDSLENLSRLLQQQKLMIQEENLQRHKNDEDKRKEISNLFTTKITEIDEQIKTHQEENEKLRVENKDLATKLSSIIEQFELKENHNSKVVQTKQLEIQLGEAKMKQFQNQTEEIVLKLKQEKVQVDQEAKEMLCKLKMHQQIEEKLKEQIDFYRDKYESFQTTISESSETFATFKKEMEKMTTQLKSLQKENHQLRQKWENSNKSAITLASEKAQSDEEIKQLKSKLEKLESLCRALQIERIKLQKSSNQKHESDIKSNENCGEREGEETKSNCEPEIVKKDDEIDHTKKSGDHD